VLLPEGPWRSTAAVLAGCAVILSLVRR